MRVELRALSLAAALGLWLASGVALADAVPPPPETCPKGQVPITSHAGPACALEAPKDCAPGYRGLVGGSCELDVCSSDQECETGHACVQVDTCQVLRELQWTGWNWSALRARSSGNLLGGPPQPAPSEDGPKAWVKLFICGQDGPCNSPAECRPMGLCYPRASIGKTQAKVVAATPVPEQLPDGVSEHSLISPDRSAESPRNSGCHKGCGVASTHEAVAGLVLPLLAIPYLLRRRRRSG